MHIVMNIQPSIKAPYIILTSFHCIFLNFLPHSLSFYFRNPFSISIPFHATFWQDTDLLRFAETLKAEETNMSVAEHFHNKHAS
jgi:hypothetical protein